MERTVNRKITKKLTHEVELSNHDILAWLLDAGHLGSPPSGTTFTVEFRGLEITEANPVCVGWTEVTVEETEIV